MAKNKTIVRRVREKEESTVKIMKINLVVSFLSMLVIANLNESFARDDQLASTQSLVGEQMKQKRDQEIEKIQKRHVNELAKISDPNQKKAMEKKHSQEIWDIHEKYFAKYQGIQQRSNEGRMSAQTSTQAMRQMTGQKKNQ